MLLSWYWHSDVCVRQAIVWDFQCLRDEAGKIQMSLQATCTSEASSLKPGVNLAIFLHFSSGSKPADEQSFHFKLFFML